MKKKVHFLTVFFLLCWLIISVSPASAVYGIMPLGDSITRGFTGSSDDTGYFVGIVFSDTDSLNIGFNSDNNVSFLFDQGLITNELDVPHHVVDMYEGDIPNIAVEGPFADSGYPLAIAIHVAEVTSTDQPELRGELSLYPNPASDYIQVALELEELVAGKDKAVGGLLVVEAETGRWDGEAKLGGYGLNGGKGVGRPFKSDGMNGFVVRGDAVAEVGFKVVDGPDFPRVAMALLDAKTEHAPPTTPAKARVHRFGSKGALDEACMAFLSGGCGNRVGDPAVSGRQAQGVAAHGGGQLGVKGDVGGRREGGRRMGGWAVNRAEESSVRYIAYDGKAFHQGLKEGDMRPSDGIGDGA